jgi:hypothetical protein
MNEMIKAVLLRLLFKCEAEAEPIELDDFPNREPHISLSLVRELINEEIKAFED